MRTRTLEAQSVFRSLRVAAALGGAVLSIALVVAPTPIRAEQSAEIVIGAIVSQTGRYAFNGAQMQAGYELAVAAINAQGGIAVGGRPSLIKLVLADDESTLARGAQVARRLVERDGAKILLGPFSGGIAEAAAPVAEKARVPLILSSGNVDSIFRLGYGFVFAVQITPARRLRAVVELASDEIERIGRPGGAVKVALGTSEDTYAQGARAGVAAFLASMKIAPLIDEILPYRATELSGLLVKTKAERADLLIIAAPGPTTALALRQIEELRAEIPILAVLDCEDLEPPMRSPAAAERALCPNDWDPRLDLRSRVVGSPAEFSKAVAAATGTAGTGVAARAAAAVEVAAAVLRRAASLESEKLRQAFQRIEIATIYGSVKFDDVGRNVGTAPVIRQVQNGRLVPVRPNLAGAMPVKLPRERLSAETRQP